ncbi:uncharacterized protein F5Z01DRAFT_595846, partial [Emericellopsis atlantica]
GGGGGEKAAPTGKRRRINYACDYCRSRKTRCDEGQPSCHACSAAGIECVTRNRRQPWLDVRRHEAGRVPNQGSTAEGRSRQQRQEDEPSAVGTHSARRVSYSSLRAEDDDPGAETSRQPGAVQSENDRPEHSARLPIIQIDSGNTPLELMTSWLDLARHRLRIPPAGPRPRAWSARNSLHANDMGGSPNEWTLPRSLGTWEIPEEGVLLSLIDSFLAGPNVLLPLLQPEKIKHAAHAASQDGPNAVAQQSGLPVLMQMYLVLVLGHAAQPLHPEPDFDAQGCLKYSESLLGLILQQSTLEALRAVTLLSMALRCHDNLAAAGHTMSLAVSMGVALGLPRYSARLPPGEERRSTWMSVFAFEKLLSFELGRPSLIPDDYPELIPDTIVTGAAQRQLASQPVFEIVLSLAKLLGEVGRWCVQVSRKEDDRSDEAMAEVVREKVRTTGLSCLKLMEWASDVCPSRYRPTSDLFFDSRLHPFTSFIAMQYHTAMILVTRNSLLISEKAIRLAVDVIAKDEPWESAVRNGQSIAVNSARIILRLFLESSELASCAALPSLSSPLHAMGVLAVFAVTRPGSRMSGMDRELLKTA